MDRSQIAERLRRMRGDKTQSEVAKDLGISVSSLSMYENGERIPRDEIKIRISNYYHRSVKTIFFD